MRRCNITCKLFLILAAACARTRGAVDAVSLTATVNGAPNPARVVRIHYTGVLGNASFTNYSAPVYAGQINLSSASGTDSTGTLLTMMPGSLAALGTFSGYCIDLTQDIYIDQAFTYTGMTDVPSATPIIAPGSDYAGMGAATALAIENLYAEEYDAVSQGDQSIPYDANPGDTDANARDQSAAFQIALWDIIYGENSTPDNIDVTSSANGFWVDGSFNSVSSFSMVVGMADEFAEAALSGPDQAFGDTMLVLSSPDYTDLLVAGAPITSQAPEFPTPSSGVIAASLVSGLAIRRSRGARLITISEKSL